MRRVSKMRLGKKLMMCASALLLALALGMCAEQFLLVSHAQSQGKVIVSSANIRKEPNGSSAALGSAFKDSEVTINHQTTGADGKIWYQVFVDADTLGYIRSDLIQITDGSTPPTKENGGTSAPSNPGTNVEVEAVNPVSATVKGSQRVRVRSSASTTSDIVTAVEKGMAITVTGKANGTDGKVWYQVNFINNGTEVKGFIRSDYVELGGELTPPVVDDPVIEPPVVDEPEQPSDNPIISSKDYETSYENEKWYLINNVEGVKYAIDDMFSVANQNQQLYTDWEKEHKKVKSQKTTIILLVIALVALGGVITYLVFKIKDMMDSAYIREVERETIRRRNESRAQGSNQKVMHTVGAEKQTGAKPAQGARPAGNQTHQARPANAGQQGARPANGSAQQQGIRPANSGVQQQGTKPAGTTQPQQARPAQDKPAGEKQAHPVYTGKSQESRKPDTAKTDGAQGNTWKSKNFMQDDDEFEFEFLHWDGEEEN
ncbi:MAG: hypothetical protein E7287_01690 [Lachnospiraceae bacterium]|nr:hypothetical protein [Lachnospiraceae bacterium]